GPRLGARLGARSGARLGPLSSRAARPVNRRHALRIGRPYPGDPVSTGCRRTRGPPPAAEATACAPLHPTRATLAPPPPPPPPPRAPGRPPGRSLPTPPTASPEMTLAATSSLDNLPR